MKNVLDGIKVIDISQVIAVPMAARHLADFGADVIHVENPQTGDSWRDFLAGIGGIVYPASEIDYNWEAWNRNKKSIAVDLKAKKGQEIIHKLVKKADVLVTNLRLWEKEKYRLDYATLKQINPKIIYGSITGFGKKGQDNNLPAYDQTAYLYRSGIAYTLPPPGAPDINFRAGFGDSVAGMILFAAVMTALFHRERTGVGQEVELSLFHTGLYQLSLDVSGALVTGSDFKSLHPESLLVIDESRTQRRLELIKQIESAYQELTDLRQETMSNPLVGDYRTKDNRVIHLNIVQPDRYWTKVCKEIIHRPELEQDPRFINQDKRIENRVDLFNIMKEAMSSRTLDEWKPILSKTLIPYAPLQTVTEVVKDPQARANNYFIPMEHPSKGKFEVIANPINLSETPATYRSTAPEFSQNTEEILLEIGYSWEEIAELKEQKIIP